VKPTPQAYLAGGGGMAKTPQKQYYLYIRGDEISIISLDLVARNNIQDLIGLHLKVLPIVYVLNRKVVTLGYLVHGSILQQTNAILNFIVYLVLESGGAMLLYTH
jgi:hypothetical protein